MNAWSVIRMTTSVLNIREVLPNDPIREVMEITVRKGTVRKVTADLD
jgi:hypothetical protein